MSTYRHETWDKPLPVSDPSGRWGSQQVETFASQNLLSAQKETEVVSKLPFRCGCDSPQATLGRAPSLSSERGSAGPAQGHTAQGRPLPCSGGLPLVPASLAQAARLQPPRTPPPPLPGAAELVRKPEKLQKEGKLGGAWRPHPVLGKGGCSGLPPPPSTAWPQTASGAASPPAATRAGSALGHMRLHSSQPLAGLPGRQAEALAWLRAKPRIRSKCKQRVILSLPPSPGGADTFDIGGDRGGRGGEAARVVFLTLFFTSLVPPGVWFVPSEWRGALGTGWQQAGSYPCLARPPPSWHKRP